MLLNFDKLHYPGNYLFHFIKKRKQSLRHFELVRPRNPDGKTIEAKNVLLEILNDGIIFGSCAKKHETTIRGTTPAVCLFETPFPPGDYLKQRFSDYCISLNKREAFEMGGRKAIYMTKDEIDKFFSKFKEEQWRVVRHELSGKRYIDWTHEREWRIPNEIVLKNLDWFDIYIEKEEDLGDFTSFREKYSNLRNILLLKTLEPYFESFAITFTAVH